MTIDATDLGIHYLCSVMSPNNSIIEQKYFQVGYALDMPWYASLPRVETRFYLEQYGGGDDVWIGKTLYR